MADDLPPPPSYRSLFEEGNQPTAGPSASSAPLPILPPDTPPDITKTPPIGAIGKSSSKSYSRQTSLDSPFPPSHPYYPGPINLPPLSPDDPSAFAGGASGNASGQGTPSHQNFNQPGGAAAFIPDGAAGYGPVTMMGVRPSPTAPIYPPPPSGGHPGAFDPAYPPPMYPPPQPTDPLINPPYNPDPPPNSSNYNTIPPHTRNAVAISEIVNIPIIEGSDDGHNDPSEDESVPPVNSRAPERCQLSTLDNYPDLQLAEGQREHIDQLDPSEHPAYFKWCMVAFFSLGSHIGFIICVCILIWQVPLKHYADRGSFPDPITEDSYSYSALVTASVFLPVCWIVATMESFISDTRTYIENTMRLADFRKDHVSVRNNVPIIEWSGESYHYEKERIVWKDGRILGRRRSSDTHKCVTKYQRIAFEFSRCVDASGDLDTFQKGVINRFEFEKTFGFMDEATKETYNVRKKTFIAAFEGHDEKYTFVEKLIVPEMKEKATVYMTEGCRTSLMSTSFYSFLTCFLLTWPYRIFFRCATRKKKFTFVKLIGI